MVVQLPKGKPSFKEETIYRHIIQSEYSCQNDNLTYLMYSAPNHCLEMRIKNIKGFLVNPFRNDKF